MPRYAASIRLGDFFFWLRFECLLAAGQHACPSSLRHPACAPRAASMPPTGVIRGRPCPRVAYRHLAFYPLSNQWRRAFSNCKPFSVPLEHSVQCSAAWLNLNRFGQRVSRGGCQLEHQHEKFRRLERVFVYATSLVGGVSAVCRRRLQRNKNRKALEFDSH